MKTKAVRLYGAMDLRTEEFDLPVITEGEVLLRVVTDSLCTSTYKAVKQGTAHKRVPPDIALDELGALGEHDPLYRAGPHCTAKRRVVVRGSGAVSAGTRAAALI